MNRCALFVDAGYLLADGAAAVYGSRRREAVSWDYPGLLQLLVKLARERTGLPVLRCYWYEATVEGRRAPEHEALADLPGLKLRVSRIRPGRREGVDAQIHRDLMTLARNSAICDAVVIGGDEDLAQVVCDVQDLGVRVTLGHLVADGVSPVSRSLRQEADDLIEIGAAVLRPYASPAESATASGPQQVAGSRPGPALTTGANQALTPAQSLPAPEPATSYGLPAGQPGQHRQSAAQPGASANAVPGQGQTPAAEPAVAQGGPGAAYAQQAAGPYPPRPGEQDTPDQSARAANGGNHASPAEAGATIHPFPAHRATGNGQGSGTTLHAVPSTVLNPVPGSTLNVLSGLTGNSSSGQTANNATPAAPQNAARGPAALPAPPSHAPGPQESPNPASVTPQQPALPAPSTQAPAVNTPPANASGPYGGSSVQYQNGSAPQFPGAQTGQYPGGTATAYPQGQPAPYTGPQAAPVPQQQTGSGGVTTLSDAVKAAHQEGHDFGESVARDAPALWLEAVLARKPRMPSDLEARLLQGSSLPIDFLLHDEVRHALRRGFWDALERARR